MSELFLIAEVTGHAVAIATDQVEAAVDLGETIAVPRAAPSIRGLAALRSRVVTVVDTALALGLAPMADSARRAVTARIDGHDYAFLVDVLEDVAAFERQSLSAGLTLVGGWHAATVGMIERGDEVVPVLDLAALVPSATAPLAA